jgi:hypothetical protein
MAESGIDRSFGRRAFGTDPASYHSVRPPYPEWVFETLVERCGLTDGTAAFEIGAGTGTATRRLLDLGASPLIAIEPNPSLAAYLRKNNEDQALQLVVSTLLRRQCWTSRPLTLASAPQPFIGLRRICPRQSSPPSSAWRLVGDDLERVR